MGEEMIGGLERSNNRPRYNLPSAIISYRCILVNIEGVWYNWREGEMNEEL